MSDVMNRIDRDCIVAAILASSMKGISDRVSSGTVTERFTNVLKELHSHGGTVEIWRKAAEAAEKK